MPEIPAPTISTSTWVMLAVCSIADSLLAVVGVETMVVSGGPAVEGQNIPSLPINGALCTSAIACPMDGTQPSVQIRELIRQCAQVVVNAPAEWLDELDRAVLGANPAIASDPELAAAVSRSNRSNLLFWGRPTCAIPAHPYRPTPAPSP